jgi:AraC-like DNA-binding protein
VNICAWQHNPHVGDAEVGARSLVLGHASRLLAAVTLSAFPNTATADPTPHDRTDHQRVLLRRAIKFIEADVLEDIGLADIAEAVRVTPRAVKYMFRRHLDTTPLQYLRRVRLHYAHQELLAADREQDTVSFDNTVLMWPGNLVNVASVLTRATRREEDIHLPMSESRRVTSDLRTCCCHRGRGLGGGGSFEPCR